ncbi:hypothetical protein SLEP1_g45442 [Rubroshorea leprosula]|uniref:Uncharacterized protein n=1 Tax=Rubroshorea leprosula TaxID=152421 RepID=A0AAV5LJV1_9ROSI|nr:hypothetical protein SLEP1_g45442 [Rubroshorea leprosula]
MDDVNEVHLGEKGDGKEDFEEFAQPNNAAKSSITTAIQR